MKRVQPRGPIDRLQNGLIAVLAVSALALAGQIGFFQALTGGQLPGQSGPASFGGSPGNVLARGNPVGLQVRNQYGRYGLCHDQAAVDALWEQGLEALLNQALAAMEEPKPSSQEDWERAVTQEPDWVCWDFQWNIPFAHSAGEGAARLSCWPATACIFTTRRAGSFPGPLCGQGR